MRPRSKARLASLAILFALPSGGEELAAQGAAPQSAEFEPVPGVPPAEGQSAPSAAPVSLRWGFLPGHTYRFVGEILFRGELPGRGVREILVEQQSRLDASPRPAGRRGVALRARSERLKIDLRAREGNLAFDSLNEADRLTPLGSHFRTDLFRWVDLELNADHRIVAVREDGRIAAETASFDHLPRFGPEELQQMVGTLFQGMPEKVVVPGETWTLAGGRTLENSVKYEFELEHRYIGEVFFEGLACHRIEIEGRLTGSAPAPGPGSRTENETGDDIETRVDILASTIEGEILFDAKLGLPRLHRQTFHLVLELAKGGEEGVPVRIPVVQEVSIRFLQTAVSVP